MERSAHFSKCRRYRYALWKPGPLAKSKLTRDRASTDLARRFFAWTGPATLGEFQGFSGLGVKNRPTPPRLMPCGGQGHWYYVYDTSRITELTNGRETTGK